MSTLRRNLLRHRRIAGWLVALALAVRLLVPTGFMPAVADGRVTVALCSGGAVQTMTIAIPGLDRAQRHGDERPAGADMPCAFAGLAMPALAAVDPVVLAAALLLVAALALRVAAPLALAAPARLRPPPIGPPGSVAAIG